MYVANFNSLVVTEFDFQYFCDDMVFNNCEI
jgi:hypothetical protein